MNSIPTQLTRLSEKKKIFFLTMLFGSVSRSLRVSSEGGKDMRLRINKANAKDVSLDGEHHVEVVCRRGSLVGRRGEVAAA